jgi:hypothetical protein
MFALIQASPDAPATQPPDTTAVRLVDDEF